MKLVACVFTVLVAFPSIALEVTTNTMTLTTEEIANCIEEGGCIIISRDRLDYMKKQALTEKTCLKLPEYEFDSYKTSRNLK